MLRIASAVDRLGSHCIDTDFVIHHDFVATGFRRRLSPGSFLSDVVASRSHVKASQLGALVDGQVTISRGPRHDRIGMPSLRKHAQTNFLFGFLSGSKDDKDGADDKGGDKDSDAIEDAPGTPGNPASYCCKGYKDASKKCTGYRVDRACMADMLSQFEKMKDKGEDFAESSKPTYCCKRGTRFCWRGLRVKHEDLKGDLPEEGKGSGGAPVSTSDIVENSVECTFKHNLSFHGCRYRGVNVKMPGMPPQGKHFQKCEGGVPELPAKKRPAGTTEDKQGKASGKHDDEDAKAHAKNDGKDDDTKEEPTPKKNAEEEIRHAKEIEKEKHDEEERNAESKELQEIELRAQEEVRPHLPLEKPEDS